MTNLLERLTRLRPLLEEIMGGTGITADPDMLEAFASDETGEFHCPPDLAVKPETPAQVAAIMKACNRLKVPVVPRGGGSGVSGGALAVQGGVVLCLEKLNRILNIDKRNMTVTVETGAITGELQEQLLAQGLCLPPDPGSKDWCQVGGNLAEAAAGPKSVKYGAFRDYVLNLEVVLPDGEVFWTGADVRKYACGYNLTQLMLGSEGTLGIITKVVFRLIAAPTESLVMRLAFPDLQSAAEMVCRLFEEGLAPSEVELLERDGIRRAAPFCGEQIDDAIAALLWVGFDGRDADKLFEDAERAAELAESLGIEDAEIAQDAVQADRLWTYRRKIGEAVIETTSFRDVDISFPRGALADIITGVKEIGAQYGFNTVCFGHVGDGNMHVQVLREELDEATWNGPVSEGIGKIYQLAIDRGGALSGEHGIGLILPPHLGKMFSPAHLNLMRAIKKSFDPENILNPGKMFLEL
ncbi:MAG: FAD-linked oxidase C-terminal domain-containing protein [Acidobacteriota bacterium]|nr:FAD-linked oxidase C-terminal domain-containing protein [Acidobacteriota bacterium]